MAYIGRRPDEVFRAQAGHDTFTGDGSTTTFDLSFDAPDNDADLAVFVDNVRQEPGSSKSYTIGADGSGNIRRITFVTAPASSAEIYVINPGRDTSLIDVADNAVTSAKIAGDAVTGAKLADDAVDSEHLTDGSVDNVHLSGSIANAKLANSAITINGTSIALGASGEIVAGTDWQSVVVADGSTQLTAEAGKGYFLDTNAGVIEVKLPASPSRGDTFVFADYGNNFGTNRAIIDTQGKLIDSTVGGVPDSDFELATNGQVVELVYKDSTSGYMIKQNNSPTALSEDTYDEYIAATGGTVLTSGSFKTHVFTGDGNFIVSKLGNEAGGGSAVEYLVIAGGGAGGTGEGASAGGGGAGGFRTFVCGSPNPLNAPAGLTVTATTFPITVGAGGTSESHLGPIRQGNDSVFSTITSAKGGAGRPGNATVCSVGSYAPVPKMNGGSGGGGTGNCGPGVGGSGNTPPVSPAQGTNGGNGVMASGNRAAGGGGGAAAAGQNGTSPNNAGDGGAGSFTPTAFWGPTSGCYGEPGPAGRYFAGGGGAQRQDQPEGSVGDGGLGGGGNGGNPAGVAGTANTGSGGGAGHHNCIGSGTGGKGIVAIRYKFQA